MPWGAPPPMYDFVPPMPFNQGYGREGRDGVGRGSEMERDLRRRWCGAERYADDLMMMEWMDQRRPYYSAVERDSVAPKVGSSPAKGGGDGGDRRGNGRWLWQRDDGGG